jgi:hypothetical protein
LPEVDWPVADRQIRVVKTVRIEQQRRVTVRGKDAARMKGKTAILLPSTNFYATNFELGSISPLFMPAENARPFMSWMLAGWRMRLIFRVGRNTASGIAGHDEGQARRLEVDRGVFEMTIGGDGLKALRGSTCHNRSQFIWMVFNQLELVLPEKRDHPYARGWSRIFTKWTKVDVVQDGWKRYRNSYSPGFRRFAESHCVGLPPEKPGVPASTEKG